MKLHTIAVAALMTLGTAAAFGPGERLVSPNRDYLLAGNDTSQLWLEDTRTHKRRLVIDEVTLQTMTLSWAPDSSAFAVNDRFASDTEVAYLYDVHTLDRLDVRARILRVFPDASRFVPGPDAAPHSYCHVLRWLDASHVEARLHGHTDGVREGAKIRPGDCFDLHFKVGRDGAVEEISRRVLPVSDQGCIALD